MNYKPENFVVVKTVEPRHIHFALDDLVRIVGSGPHPQIPQNAYAATICVAQDSAVRISFECYADRQTIELLAPDLLCELDNQPEHATATS